jgi:branched-subunit amino acid aminotransferase/4-amino-4-deoxychorismate lyase
MTENPNPRFEVWSTVAWDGKESLLAASLHFDRMERHAHRLNFSLPENFRRNIFKELTNLDFSAEPIVQEDQPPFLVKISITNEGIISLNPRLNQSWPNVLKAITVSAPRWNGEIRGTKHGDWKPYFDARKMALENNVDISLLIENNCLIDGDRCMPILLDKDGTAYYPRVENGALDSITLEQIYNCLENSGIPIRPAIITMNLILRAKEMIVIGSGMGIQSLGAIDGRSIGKPRGRLYESAMSCWLSRLSDGWESIDEVS